MNVPFLLVLSGRSQGKEFSLEKPITRIGRSSRNDIRLVDDEVSRVHAEIRRAGSLVTLLDLGSSNGSFVNQKRVGYAQLDDGDAIQIGTSQLLFVNPLAEKSGSGRGRSQVSSDDDSSDLIPLEFRRAKENAAILQQNESALQLECIGDGGQRPSVVIARSTPEQRIVVETLDIIRTTNDEGSLLRKILDKVFEMTQADRGTVLIYCPQTRQYLTVATIKRGGRESLVANINVSDTILRYVTGIQAGVMTHDARSDDRWCVSDSLLSTGVQEAICVPLIGKSGILGVIYVDTYAHSPKHGKHNTRFSRAQLETVHAVAQQAAMALELSRYYGALIESERLAAIGEFTATISHNVKNSIQAIRSGSYMVENGLEKESWKAIRSGWRIINEQQELMFNLFLNILSYSRPVHPVRQEIPVVAVFEKVFRSLESQAAQKRVALEGLERIPGQLRFAVDEQGIHHALVNLIANAIDASQGVPQPIVSISCVVTDPTLIGIVIEDRGCGIPESIQGQLLERFVSTKGYRGSGLGVMSAKKIIEEHQGSIHFQTKVGHGTKFFVNLPVVSMTPPFSADGQADSTQTKAQEIPREFAE